MNGTKVKITAWSAGSENRPTMGYAINNNLLSQADKHIYEKPGCRKTFLRQPKYRLRATQMRATPLRRAASATALATAGPTRWSKAAGMM